MVVSSWKKLNLGEILKESRIPVKTEDTNKRLTVKLHLQGVSKREPRATDQVGSTRYYERKAGQFIYGKQNLHNGAIGIVPDEFDEFQSTQDVPAFDVSDKVDTKWLYYYFARKEFYSNLESLSTGTGSKRIQPKELFKLTINLPPLFEQKEIVAILSSVDDLICKSEKIINQTEKLKNGLMQQLLTKGIGHTKFKDTELGEIPEGWVILPFKDVLNFVGSGITPKGGSSVYQTEGIPFIRSQNVYPEGLRQDDIAFISDVIHNKMSRSKVREHDVLLNITGASIGRCTFVPTGFGEANVNQHVCILRTNERVNFKYLALFISSSLGQRQIFLEQAGQTREGLNYQQIRSFIISLPSLEEQRRISSIIESITEKINVEKQNLENLQRIKSGLMQDVLTGKVRVSVAEEEVITS